MSSAVDAGYSSYQDGRLSIPPEEPEYTPAEYCGECTHQSACRMQWERFNGGFEDGYEGWLEALALALGCGEDCMAYGE